MFVSSWLLGLFLAGVAVAKVVALVCAVTAIVFGAAYFARTVLQRR